MSSVPTACQSLANQLSGLEKEIKDLQSDLLDAVGGAKAVIARAIQTKSQERDKVKKQLDDCIVKNQPTQPEVPPPMPSSKYTYNMVVFGDSIAWGQGLAENEKYSTRLATYIESRFGNRLTVLKKVYAHSGAKIRYDSDNKDDKAWANKFGTGYVMNDRSYGEIPSTFPTIDQQISIFSNDPNNDAQKVDLVLLDGGINDIGVFTILNPTTKTSDLKEMVVRSCYNDMKSLLTTVRKRFYNPKTKIVVTGYYPILSTQSDLGAVTYFLSMLGLATAGIIGAFTPSVARDRIVNNSTVFEQTANNNLARAVADTDALDGNRGRFLFANPYFGPWNAIFTSLNSLIYGLDLNLLKLVTKKSDITSTLAVDSVKATRSTQCISAGERSSTFCPIASVGHPNPVGATWYLNSITSVLFPIPVQCKPVSNQINGLRSELQSVQAELNTASPGEKPALAIQIKTLNNQIQTKQKLLDECIQADIDATFSKMINP